MSGTARRSKEEHPARLARSEMLRPSGTVPAASPSPPRMEALVEQLPQLVWRARADGFVEYMNRRWYEFTGLTQEESLGSGWIRALHPDDVEQVCEISARAVQSGTPYEVECRYRRSDGAYRWALTRGVPEQNELGELIGWVGTSTDISKHKLVDQALQESEARFRNMADHAPVLLWVTDQELNCTYLNRLWYEFTGQSETEALGQGWLRAVHSDDAPRVEALVRARTDSPLPVQIEYRLRRHDGVYRWAILAAAPRIGRQGEFLGYVGSVIDITERKMIEQERSRLLREAQTAVRLRDEFLAIAGHELKTPLTILQLQLQDAQRLARSADAEPGRISERLDKAVASAQRLARLVGELLDISRITTGKLKLEHEPLDLAEVATEVLTRFREAARAVGSELVCSVQSVRGTWDRLRVEQVVSNLLSNAVKYGRGRPIELSVEQDSDLAVLRVRDHGIGVDAEDKERIFGRFERAVSIRHYGGFGLGLWIVRQIVQALGGSVMLESDPGEGSTFTIRLPRTPPS